MIDQPSYPSRASQPRRSGRGLIGAACVALAAGLMPPAPVSAAGDAAQPRERPFLICTRDQFDQLRRRADREPWATMKAKALRTARGQVSGGDGYADMIRLQRYFGACSLAYILEPDHRSRYADRVREAIINELAEVEFSEKLKHRGVVPPMGAAFVAIIALDVVHDGLDAAQIDRCEAVIGKQVGRINRGGAWPLARLGTHGTWDLYTGRRTSPDDRFYKEYRKQITEDGVTRVATSYAWARLLSSSSRPQKTGYADVLEFTGIDQRYYQNPRLEKFYRWLFGSAVTPAKQLHAIGDFIPRAGPDDSDRPALSNAALAYRAGRFDPMAGRHAAWALEGREPPGHILAYVLKRKRYEPKAAPSRLYPDGGAFLREPADTPDSLAAALYNITSRPDWHANQETNAVSLSAYGARLLMNGGWLGPPTRPAPLQNTLTINGKEHERRTGAGLDQGLTSAGFDYAAGRSGEALPDDASFTRSLLLVHSRDGAGGYFLTVDEVEAQPGDTVHHYVHPSTRTEPEVIEPGTEYEAKTELFNRANTARLSVFYGAAPQRVRRKLVPSGSDRADRPKHYRLEATFPTDGTGAAKPLAVLFPHDERHPKASFERITDGPTTGVTIAHANGVRDYACASDGKAERRIPGEARFQGRAVLFREADRSTAFYFVRNGTLFRRGPLGFSAERPASIHIRGETGRISTEQETTVTFYHPRVAGIVLDGQRRAPNAADEGWARFTVPPGSNQPFRLLTAGR